MYILINFIDVKACVADDTFEIKTLYFRVFNIFKTKRRRKNGIKFNIRSWITLATSLAEFNLAHCCIILS